MLLYLYMHDGKPTYGTDLHRLQGALEDKIRDRPEVSDVWWSEESPYTPRVYLYGASHSDYEAANKGGHDAELSWEEDEQLIFPVDVEEPKSMLTPLDTLSPVVAQMSLTITSKDGTRTITRGYPASDWPDAAKGRADCLKAFNRDAEWALINGWIKEEGS